MEKRTWKLDYRDAFRLLNLVRKEDPGLLPQQLLRALLVALSPFVSLYLTAVLLDRLIAGDLRGGAVSAASSWEPCSSWAWPSSISPKRVPSCPAAPSA